MGADHPHFERVVFDAWRRVPHRTFTVAGLTLLKRMALVIDDGVVAKVFYPVFPPDKNAEDVIAWLKAG